jgi:hypothetical protein
MASTTSHLFITKVPIFCKETMSYTGGNANRVQTYTPYSSVSSPPDIRQALRPNIWVSAPPKYLSASLAT